MRVGGTTVSGGCLCGAVRYDVEGAPLWVAHCHCADCRRACGAAFATYAGFTPDRVRFVKGEPKSIATSPGVTRRFCGRCGSPLSYASTRWPDEIHIFVCTLDAPETFAPTMHVYTKDQLSFVRLADDLPRSEETSG